MRWTERQLAMLREMGIRVWAPATAEPIEDGAGEAVLVAERSAPPATPPVAAPTSRAPAAPAHARVVERAAPASPERAAPASAEWLVVGEPVAASAATESGGGAEEEQLLDNMLRAVRVSRRAGAREGRAFHLATAAASAADLDAAIETVRPRCILALGRAPALALLGVDEPLGKLRERTHERAGIPVVVTFALPYLLRHAEDKPRAWADLCRAVAAAG